MRDYLYIWNDPDARFIIASGLDFRSLASHITRDASILLLKHRSESASLDLPSGFAFASHADIPDLLDEHIYNWGDFAWTDYQHIAGRQDRPPVLPAEEVAELLYFAHARVPLRKTLIPSLGNRFLAFAHDDGWFLQLHYTESRHVIELLASAVRPQLDLINMSALMTGECAFWVERGAASAEEITFDVDSVINRRFRRDA